MAGWKKVLELIGIIDASESESEESNGPRYHEEANDEPRYTPRSRVQSASDARGSRFGGTARPSGAQRPRTENPRSRAGADGEGDGYGVSRAPRGGKMQPKPTTIVYYLHTFPECSNVIMDLVAGNSVLLNLEETDMQLQQRVVDTLAGAAFALGAKIRKVSLKMYLISPESENVFETASVNRRY